MVKNLSLTELLLLGNVVVMCPLSSGNTSTFLIFNSSNNIVTSKFLPFEDIKLYDELGSGNFGVVTRGTYFIRNESGENTFELPVAVKILNSENEESSEESLKEAETMISLKHKNIIKLIGVCFCFTSFFKF